MVCRGREKWIDRVKVFACILVVLGHFLQSMYGAELIKEGPIGNWFLQTIYCFHVPLFFICSGYLYQKFSVVDSLRSWHCNVIKKLVVLGVPYFTFSLITWTLKVIFSGAVNNQVNGLGYDLFVHPQSPYWFLYTLFFIFLITPTFCDGCRCWAGLFAALLLKIVEAAMGGTNIYALASVACYGIWFVLGLSLCVFNIHKKIAVKANSAEIGIILFGIFGLMSVAVAYFEIDSLIISFLMGLIACTSVVIIAAGTEERASVLDRLSAYTMPIFLMHTIFAAGLRSVLFKMGIHSLWLHSICGISVSFLGPILAAKIMKRTNWLEFFLYPTKVIKFSKKNR